MIKVSPRIMEYAAAAYQFNELSLKPNNTNAELEDFHRAREVLIKAEARLTQLDRDYLNGWL